MEITFVVAASENNVIGKDGGLPWHLPVDFQFFKKMTMDKPMIMGRKTFESLGKPLPHRQNIVLSKSLKQAPEGTYLFGDISEALESLEKQGVKALNIIGGGQIFSECLPMANIIYLTRVHTTIENGNAFFPELNPKEWTLVWEEFHAADKKNEYSFTFQKWVRE